MWSRRSTLTFSWNMLGCVQIQPLCSLSLIWANTRWYWSIPSFPTEHRGVWGSREVSYRQPQKGLEEPSRQGNHSDQLLMLPELMGLYIVASVGFLWGKYHVQTNKHNSLNTTKVNSYLIQSIRIESHLVLRTAAPLPPPLQVVQGPVRASLLCKEVFTLQDNVVKKPCCLAQALNFSLWSADEWSCPPWKLQREVQNVGPRLPWSSHPSCPPVLFGASLVMAFFSLVFRYGTLPWNMVSLHPELKPEHSSESLKTVRKPSRKFTGAPCENSMFQPRVLKSLDALVPGLCRCTLCAGGRFLSWGRLLAHYSSVLTVCWF